MYRHLQQLFDMHLEDYTRSLKSRRPKELYEPEHYILSLGGKRIRPLLALVACELSGGKAPAALDCALAVEIFHNFSLVHDDILDAAPLRRAQPTVHERYGLNLAILGGDAMLVRAFSCLQRYEGARYREVSTLLQRTAIEVCEGQQLDMNFERSGTVTVDEYIEMIRLKTAVLLGCSLEMGAACADAPAEMRQQLSHFGKHLGIAFQLLDDLLDCFPSSQKTFGKKTGGDIAANKKTFLWIKALTLADQGQRKKLEELASLGADHTDAKIKGITEIFAGLEVDRLCREEADRHTARAIGHLRQINCDHAKKEMLEQFSLGLLQRQS